MHQPPVLDVGFAVELEDHAVAKFLFVGTERADEIAKPFGQHGDGAVDQIDAGGSFHGLLVDDGTFFHIVRHVGNVHTDFVEIAIALF